MYVEFKNGEKYASVIADVSPMHEAFEDAGYVLADDDLVIDIDNLPIESIKAMIQAFDIKTQIVWTSRGAHLYYKKPKGFKAPSKNVCPLGFEVEFKHKKNTKAITIKRHGKLREIDNLGVREELPSFLYTRLKLDSLNGLGEGDGRNQKLHAHKFRIMSVPNYKKCLSFINSYVFAEPLDQEELNTVSRTEQIKAEKDGEYEVAMALKTQLKVVKYSDRLYNYNGTRYVADNDFKALISSHLLGQKTRYIDEVIKQMEYRIHNIPDPENGFDIKFKNGILRNGQFIEVDSQEFTPYYIDIEYKEDANPVQAVDDFLDFLTESDKEYRQLILECLAHTLITNAEFKRQLAKFFVFIGDGGNGKGTMLTVIRKILGTGNCSSLSPESMTKESYFTSLQGKLCNLGDDIEDRAINEKQMKVLKNISTCDLVESRELYKQSKEVVVTASLIFTSNHLLKSFEKGESYKRRVIWMPMFGKVAKKDPKFITNLTTDEALEYWLKLIVDAYYDLHNNHCFTESEKVKEYNDTYHEENNGTLTFIGDYEPEDFIGKRPPVIYDEYKVWAEENGVSVQSKKILKETIETQMGLIVGCKSINGKTAKVYMKK